MALLKYLLVVICGFSFFLYETSGSEPVNWSSVLPFNRLLELATPPLKGNDVVILQNLLRRSPGISFPITGEFDIDTKNAVQQFQNQHGIVPSDGKLNVPTARKVLDYLIYDNYEDDGSIPDGAMFKIYVPVHRDRNIETTGKLMDAQGTILHAFTIRSRGGTTRDGHELNQLATNGNSPTGLMTMDLNSKEPDPKKYGPYPVLRCVKGQAGNAAIGKDANDTFISDYRSGILIHTGQWLNWQSSQPMPNSHGCFHVHPEDMKAIVEILTRLGVQVNQNPFGRRPYPYKTQGVISVEQID